MRYFFILFFSFILAFSASSQDKLDFGDTEKTNEKPTYKSDPSKFEAKRIRHWIVNKPRGTLKGNKCFEDVCNEMGFEFVVQSKDQRGSYNGLRRVLHNFGVKTTLLFKNGPFWKLKLRKKRKECLRETHDFNG